MGGEGGGRLFEAGRLLTFSAFSMGAYSRWALIRGWALIRINTVHAFWVTVFTEYDWTVGQTGEKIYPFSNQHGYLWTGPNFHSLVVNC